MDDRTNTKIVRPGQSADLCPLLRLLPMLAPHAACPVTPSGYSFALRKDVVGNDIACTPLGINSTADLAKLCQTTSACVAFNVFLPAGGVPTYCLKNARTPLSDQSTTWMKGACQGIYTSVQRRAQLGMLLLRCSALSAGAAFWTEGERLCVAPSLPLTCVACAFLVTRAGCSAPSGYSLATGMDVVGNDIACTPLGTNSTADLARVCQTTSGCVAFNVFQPAGGVPTYCLKNARTPLSDQSMTWMKGACQGIYTGAQRRAQLGRHW